MVRRLRKYHIGENTISRDMVNRWIASQEPLERLWNKTGATQKSGEMMHPNLIWVKNDTVANLGQWKILGLKGSGGVVFNRVDNAPSFQARQYCHIGEAPGPRHFGSFCILLEAIRSGRIGLAAVGGMWPTQVDFKVEDDFAADVDQCTSGDYNLISGQYGTAKIIGTETAATGLQWCVVQLNTPSLFVHGKLAGTLSPGGSATLNVYNFPSSSWAANGDTLTVWAPPYFTAGTVASGKWVRAAWDYSSCRLEVDAREC